MLWRPSYHPILRAGVALPEVQIRTLNGTLLRPEKVFVGGFDLLSLGEIEIWRRLMGEAFPSLVVPVGLAIDGSQEATLEAATARSRHASTGVIDDAEALREEIKPDRPERSFAWADGLLVIGAPTEEVWDEFQQVLAPKA